MDNETVKLRHPLLDCCGETPMIFRDTIAKMLCITCVKCGESVHAKPEETIQQLAERWNAAMLERCVSETVDRHETPLSYQVGGDHYKKYEYQPIEFFNDVRLDFNRANAIKYLARWKDKGGVEDLRKAVQYLRFAEQERDKQIDFELRFLAQFDKTMEGRIIEEILDGCLVEARSEIDDLIDIEEAKAQAEAPDADANLFEENERRKQ